LAGAQVVVSSGAEAPHARNSSAIEPTGRKRSPQLGATIRREAPLLE